MLQGVDEEAHGLFSSIYLVRAKRSESSASVSMQPHAAWQGRNGRGGGRVGSRGAERSRRKCVDTRGEGEGGGGRLSALRPAAWLFFCFVARGEGRGSGRKERAREARGLDS